jgi:mitotic spindle assembly checkpoint protein MAD1
VVGVVIAILYPDSFHPRTDPQLSTAKRQQRTQALNSTLSQASLERKLAAAEATRVQLETRLRERDATIERLEADRRWLAEREQEEREEKERISKEREDEKVGSNVMRFMGNNANCRQKQTRTSVPCVPN